MKLINLQSNYFWNQYLLYKPCYKYELQYQSEHWEHFVDLWLKFLFKS